MPFYIQTVRRRPWWHIALVGAGIMLIWAAAQALLISARTGALHPTALRLVLAALALTLVGGAVAGGLYWLLGWQPLAKSTPLRWATATVLVLVYLIALTLAASQGEPLGPWSRVLRSTFLLSTLFLALVLAWFIAKDPLGVSSGTRRIYLTPAEFAALPQESRDRLRAETPSSSASEEPGRAG